MWKHNFPFIDCSLFAGWLLSQWDRLDWPDHPNTKPMWFPGIANRNKILWNIVRHAEPAVWWCIWFLVGISLIERWLTLGQHFYEFQKTKNCAKWPWITSPSAAFQQPRRRIFQFDLSMIFIFISVLFFININLHLTIYNNSVCFEIWSFASIWNALKVLRQDPVDYSLWPR